MRSETLAARDVWFAYDGVFVLRGVSCSLEPGESLAIGGANGSGKTTLLSLLSGVLPPARGTVALGDQPLDRFPARDRARRIGVVPQHVDPRLQFRVDQLVAMGRTSHRSLLGAFTAADRAAVDDAMRFTDCLELAGRPFAELSGGERQRVVLAMALAQQAQFLLLDEPTVHLDVRHQRDLLERLRRLRRERNVGTIAVLHDFNLAALYFDQLLLLEHGMVVAQGSPAQVLRGDAFRNAVGAPFSLVSHPTAGVPQVLVQPD